MKRHISIFALLLCAFATVGWTGAVSAATAGYPYYKNSGTTSSDAKVVYSDDGVNYTAVPPAGRKVGNWGWALSGGEAMQYITVKWANPVVTAASYSLAGIAGTPKAAVRFDYIPLTVTFNGNGGSGAMDPIKDLNIDSTFNLTANAFTKTGYHFIGWKTNQTQGVVFADGAEIKGSDLWNGTSFNSTFYAQWDSDAQIVLDNHGADLAEGTKSVTVAPGEDLPKIAVPQKTGHDFKGYFSEENGEGEQYWSAKGFGQTEWTGTGVSTSHAHWVAHEYKIEYRNLEDAAGYPSLAKYGVTIELAELEQPGLTFAGWNIAAGLASKQAGWHQSEQDWSTVSTSYQTLKASDSNPTKTIWLRNLNTNDEATVTISANWTTNSYKINLKFTGAINDPTEGISVEYGAIPGGIARVPDYAAGLVFAGYADAQGNLWYGADGKLTATYAGYHWDRVEDLELTAVTGGIEYFIAYDANAKHGGAGAEPKQTCDTTKQVTLSQGANMSNPSHLLVGWSKNQDARPDAVGANFIPGGHPTYAELGITKDNTEVTLYAIWKDRRVAIGINAAGGTASTNGVAITELVYVDGEEYGFLPDAERPKYHFDGWYSAAEGGARIEPDTIVSKEDVPVLYAHWSPEKFYVRFDGNGATNETPMAVQVFVFNEEKRLLPNEYGRVGYEYAGWVTNDTGKTKVYDDEQMVSNLTETVGATNVLYALWDPHHYTITFDGNGGKGDGPPDIGNCAYGEVVNLPQKAGDDFPYAPPKNYATFIGWSTNKSDTVGVYTVSNLTAEAGGVVTVYAVWSYDVDEWSRVLDCDNLKFENGGDRLWIVEDDGAVTGSDKCLRHFDDLGQGRYGEIYAELDESGTLTYWWKGKGDGEEHYLWVCLTEDRNWSPAIAEVTSIDSHNVLQDQEWTESSVKITVPVGEKRYVWFAHKDSIPVSIDCVTWTPDGGGHPEPTDANKVTISSAAVSGGKFSLSFKSDERFDYNLLTNANLLIKEGWGVMEMKKGIGADLSFEPAILPGLPQLFYKVETIQKKD